MESEVGHHPDPRDGITEDDFEAVVRQNRQRRVYRRKPRQVADLMAHIVARRGIAVQQSSTRLQSLWDSIVGIDVANQTVVGSVKRGCLEIVVSNSSMLQSLSFQKKQILKKIQTQMTDIRDLRFRIGRIG